MNDLEAQVRRILDEMESQLGILQSIVDTQPDNILSSAKPQITKVRTQMFALETSLNHIKTSNNDKNQTGSVKMRSILKIVKSEVLE